MSVPGTRRWDRRLVPEASLRQGRSARRSGAKALLYILPAAVIYGVFAIWPALSTVQMSFLEWDGILPPRFIGMDNYVDMFKDPLLYGSIIHSLILIVFFSFIPVVLGLVMTALLMGKVRRGMTFFRVVFFLPQVLPLVAVGITWRWMYAEDGLVNQFLNAVGLSTITRAWLGDYYLALIAIGFIGTWCVSGLCMVLFISGAQKIDTALYEAASLDGAGFFRQFLSVTLPGLRGEITIAGVITTIAGLASFDLVYVTTNGGPVNQTTVPGLLVYRLAFQENQIGAACALAVALTVLIIAVVSVIRVGLREKP
ncbi:MAG: sugar ABC transporter permease [Microbacterium sp. 69-10]|nr:MAG: sugar ABC transporter permease [Microbacterium sp. 69-10]